MSSKQYHIGLSDGETGGYVLLPGDPGRCEEIAAFFENPVKVAQNREYTTYTGTLLNQKVSVTSTGIGGPSAAIAIEELAAVGAHTFIRVGTCGGIHKEVRGGDIVIANAAVRQEGTSKEYVPVEFPAVSDFYVTQALAEAAQKLNVCADKDFMWKYHLGTVQSKDSFYGQHDPDRMPAAAELKYKWDAWKKANVLASEMEAAALFIAAAVREVRCGAVFTVVWNQERKAAGINEEPCHDSGNAVRIAIKAMEKLIERDVQMSMQFD